MVPLTLPQGGCCGPWGFMQCDQGVASGAERQDASASEENAARVVRSASATPSAGRVLRALVPIDQIQGFAWLAMGSNAPGSSMWVASGGKSPGQVDLNTNSRPSLQLMQRWRADHACPWEQQPSGAFSAVPAGMGSGSARRMQQRRTLDVLRWLPITRPRGPAVQRPVEIPGGR
jgi:hypothetical protein